MILQDFKPIIACLLSLSSIICRGQVSESAFRNPPQDAKVSTFWHWMNGNVNKDAITADLEYMSSAGYGDAVILDVFAGVEKGPVAYGSGEWSGLLRHACSEAARLGMTLGMHNSPGYSAVGGPWITPSESMKQLTWSDTTVSGKVISCQLPKPWSKLGYYEDIRVLAYPCAGCERPDTSDPFLVDGNLSTEIRLDSLRHDMYFDFKDSVPVSRISLRRGTREPPLDPHDGPRDYGSEYLVECSKDGLVFDSVAVLYSNPLRSLDIPALTTFDRTCARCWRLTTQQKASVAEVAFYDVISRKDVIDLTHLMKQDGSLTWQPPYDGEWNIVRIGQTSTGKMTTVSPESGTGLEVDKLSPRGADLQFDLFLDPLFRKLAPYVGTTLKTLLIDSWEAGGQDWTSDFECEFRERRGYPIGPMLLAMTGRIVDSEEKTEDFLADVRRTKCDLFNDFLSRFAERTHRWNLLLAGEPYGDGDFVREEYASLLDMPMSEWWTHYVYGSPATTRYVASEARKRDIRLIGAECYTGTPFNSKFSEHPYGMKALGDWMMTLGTSRFYLHSYALQPWLEPRHIMTMGPFGSHLDRNSAWAAEAVHWNMYNARCAAMLQQGEWVEGGAALKGSQDDSQLHFTHRKVGGEEFFFITNHRRRKESVLAEFTVPTELIPEIWDPMSGSTRIPVTYARKDSVVRIEIPLEQSGSVFVVFRNNGSGKEGTLPEHHFVMHPSYEGSFTYSVWAKPETMAYGNRGQIVYGGKNHFGLAIGTNAIRIYDGTTMILEWEHPVSGWTFVSAVLAKGKMILYVNGEKVATAPCRENLQLAPDTLFTDDRFVASFEGDNEDPVIEGRALGQDEILSAFNSHAVHTDMDKDWTVEFPGWSGASMIHLDTLNSLHRHPDFDVSHFGGKAVYRKRILLTSNDEEIRLDLGRVEHIAKLTVNGKDCGIRWKAPYVFDISEASRIGWNDLEVEVTTLYVNRLIGDALLPSSERKISLNWPHFNGTEPLIETGLTGGVRLLSSSAPSVQPIRRAEIVIDTARVSHHIDKKIYGLLLEHIYHSLSNGLVGENVWNRSFEECRAYGEWSLDSSDGCLSLDASEDKSGDFRIGNGADCILSFDVEISGPGTVLVGMRDQNRERMLTNRVYWRLSGPDGEDGILEEATGWVWYAPVAKVKQEPAPGRLKKGWNHIEMHGSGPHIQCVLNGQTVYDGEVDGCPTSGSVTIGGENCRAMFKNIRLVDGSGEPLPVSLDLSRHWHFSGNGTMRLEMDGPLNDKVATELNGRKGLSIFQEDKFSVKKGESVSGSVFLKGNVRYVNAELIGTGGRVLGRQTIKGISHKWKSYELDFMPEEDDSHVGIAFKLARSGKLSLDQVSLMAASSLENEGFRVSLDSAVRALSPTVLRWPGGSFSERYHFENGIGPQHEREGILRWDDCDPLAFGTDEFLEYSGRVGAEPQIVVPIGYHNYEGYAPGDEDWLARALQWMDYCRKQCPDRAVMYWEVDNEVWKMDPGKYVELVQQFSREMKKHSPGVKIIACGCGRLGAEGPGLDSLVIFKAGKDVDYISPHYYQTLDKYGNDGVEEYGAYLDKLANWIAHSENPAMKIYVSEWNLDGIDMRTGLFAGGFLNRMERTPAVEMAAAALAIRHVGSPAWNNAFINFDKDDWFPAPNYVVMKLWRDHFLPLCLDVDRNEDDLNVVVTTSVDKSQIAVKIVNPDDEGRYLIVHAPNGTGELSLVSTGNLFDRNDLNCPDRISVTRQVVPCSDGVFLLYIPSFSAGVLLIETIR